MPTNPNELAAKAWEQGCGAYEDATGDSVDQPMRDMVLAGDAAAQAAIAAVYAPLFEELSDNGELLTIAWMDGSHSSNTAHRARIAELEADAERVREALGRCAEIVERHNWRQSEKVDDVKIIARTALGASHDQ